MTSMRALLFCKKETNNDNNNKHCENLVKLHKDMNVFYQELTDENERFIDKRLAYEANINALNNKKNEVDNRLQYLSGVKSNMKEKLNVGSLDLKELKDLCQTYVEAFTDIELAQNEMHVLELEISTVYANWDDEKTKHDNTVQSIKKQIDDIQLQIIGHADVSA